MRGYLVRDFRCAPACAFWLIFGFACGESPLRSDIWGSGICLDFWEFLIEDLKLANVIEGNCGLGLLATIQVLCAVEGESGG